MFSVRKSLVLFGLISIFASSVAVARGEAGLYLRVDPDSFVVVLKNESLYEMKINQFEYGKYLRLSFSSVGGSEEPWIKMFSDAFDRRPDYRILEPGEEVLVRIPFELVEQFVGLGSGCYEVSAKYRYAHLLETDEETKNLQSTSVEVCNLWVNDHAAQH